MTPDGACLADGGELIPFARTEYRGLFCEPFGDGVRLARYGCQQRLPETQQWATCGAVSGPYRVERGPIEVDEPGTCGFVRPYPLGQALPVPAPARLCTDLATSDCGSPVRFDIELDAIDPCSSSIHDRCVARFDGAEVAVEITSHQSLGGCETSVGDRVAHCAVIIGAPGDYPVRTTDGVALGTVTVGDGRAAEARTCLDVP